MKIENTEFQNGLISRSCPKIEIALIELFLIPQVLQQSSDSMSQFHSMLLLNLKLIHKTKLLLIVIL